MKKKSIFLWFLLFIFLTTYNFDFEEGPINSFFTIKKIEVNGIQNVDPSVIQERLDIFHGKNIIILDSKQLIKTIAGVDFVKDIKIKKYIQTK